MLFAVLMWTFAFLVYASNRRSKANIWCAISGLIFSLGAVKEYYFFELLPRFPELSSNGQALAAHTAAYSIMTYIMYNYAMPALFLFACYFAKLEERKPALFRWVAPAAFLPAVVLAFIYPPALTRSYQLEEANRIFWYVYSVYNIGFGAAMTCQILRAIRREHRTALRRQKQLIAFSILPPVWFWLLSVFPIHSLRLKTYFKLWQLTAFIVALSIAFFIYSAFREGIMGLRLKGESYKWDANMRLMNKSAQYTGHILKNETSKIEWCLDRLEHSDSLSGSEELSIIRRSVTRLLGFVHKNQMYSEEIVLADEWLSLESLIREALDSVRSLADHRLTFQVEGVSQVLIKADRSHFLEMLNNLIANASDAMNKSGLIRIMGHYLKNKHLFQLTVEDNGPGIPEELLPRIFEPYFTTKRTKGNYGLGLAYCANVIHKHNGKISVSTAAGHGASFHLAFPVDKRITLAPAAKVTHHNT